MSLQISNAQNNTIITPINSLNWKVYKGESTFETFDNRETLVLNGKVILKNINFSNGTIEVDVYTNESRSFAGIIFRKQEKTMEEVYMRFHKTNQADALQYSPIYNDESNWQLYREHQANVGFKNKGWNTLRIEINKNNADIFVNNENVLTVNNLKTTHSNGEIGLFSLFNNRFSNFRLTNKDVGSLPKIDSNINIDLNIISQWNITEAFPYIEHTLTFNNFSEEEYNTVSTERSGLLPFSKYIEKPPVGNFKNNKEFYSVASTVIESNNNQVKSFSFDYSDKIIVYLNGKEIFKGNNAFRSKGIQYQGHLDIDANKLYLNLKKGKNTLHCVVIDEAYGWGLMGKLE